MSYTDIIPLLQFTIKPEEEQYTCLLNILAENGINIRAISQIGRDGHIIVKFIPNIPGEEQGTAAIIGTRNILDYLGIFYTEQIVLAVALLNVPGQLAAIQRLFFCRVEVRASYIDETLRQIYEVNNLELAERILRTADVQTPVPTDCLACNCDESSTEHCDSECSESETRHKPRHDFKREKHEKHHNKHNKHNKCEKPCKEDSVSYECFEITHDKHNKHGKHDKHGKNHHNKHNKQNKCEKPCKEDSVSYECFEVVLDKHEKHGKHHEKHERRPIKVENNFLERAKHNKDHRNQKKESRKGCGCAH